jgi:hypothetical protein
MVQSRASFASNFFLLDSWDPVMAHLLSMICPTKLAMRGELPCFPSAGMEISRALAKRIRLMNIFGPQLFINPPDQD